MKKTQCPLNKRMSGPQSHSGTTWRKEKSLASAEFEPQIIQPVTDSLYYTFLTPEFIND
jgi:hypothetical protein